MSLSGSLVGSQFTYLTASANPVSATFRSFQYTLLNRGEDIRRNPGIVIQDTLNNAPNSASFTVDGNAPIPQIGEKIEIRDSFDNDRRLFAGTIQTIEQIYEGQVDQLAWKVQAIDFTWLANRRRPYGNYTNTSVSLIVKDLISKYAPGFTTAHVQTNLAKISATFDGSKDLITCLNELASAIGGGHWYFDYDMDLHFFHVVPPGLVVPPSAMPSASAHMTVAEAGASPGGSRFSAGYYLFRHTFIYSDGTESSYQMCSNLLLCTGRNILSFTGLPIGAAVDTNTVVARRVYYNRFITGYPGGDPIEKINGFCQVNDNTTTAFTCWFGQTNVDTGTRPTEQVGPVQSDVTGGSVVFPANSLYSWFFTFKRISDGLESLPGPAVSFTTPDGSNPALLQACGIYAPGMANPLTDPAPSGYTRQWYRTKANGTLYYAMVNPTPVVIGNGYEEPSGVLLMLDYMSDANLGAPYANPNGIPGASVGTVIPIASVKTYSTSLVSTPGSPLWVQLSDQAATLNLTGTISNGSYGDPNSVVADPTKILQSLLQYVNPTFTNAALPPSWSVGDQLQVEYTGVNANGETTPHDVHSIVLGAGSGPNVVMYAPLIGTDNFGHLPGFTAFNAYASTDGGASFHLIGTNLPPGRPVVLSLTKAQINAGAAPPTLNTCVVGIARGWVGYNGLAVMGEGAWLPPVAGSNIVYYASPDVAAALEAAVDNAAAQPPKKTFTGHPSGPTQGPTGSIDVVSGANFWNGGRFQFKYAYLYRDGSVSFPSPPSPNIEQLQTYGQGIKGFNLQNIQVGPTISGLDVIARFIYFSQGLLANPNYSYSGSTPIGFVWPIPFLDPTWASPGGIIVIPDNTSTSISQFSLADLGTAATDNVYAGALVGAGNVPYGNKNQQAVSVDPIPMWPNPDGPWLEDTATPVDIDDDNDLILHEDSGSQPFTVTTDLSQIRNRVTVIGAGSVTSTTANIGDTQILIADVTAFSPHGGTLRYADPGTGKFVQLRYNGVTGVVGSTAVVLSTALSAAIPQGVNISNFFQADDVESQNFLAKVELDKDGKKTDGIHEYTIVDTSLKAVFQLFMRGMAELELYSKPLVMIKYATRDPLSTSGVTVHVDLTNPPCLGDFLIQTVTIDQIHDESDDLAPRYTVTAVSSKFDLNDLLLKIIGGSVGGGGASNSGIVPAGVVLADTSTALNNGLPNSAAAKRKFAVLTIRSGSAIDTLANGLNASWNSSGSGPFADDTSIIAGVCSNWVRFTPIDLNANLCGYTSAAAPFWDQRPKCVFRFRTAPNLNGLPIVGNPLPQRVYWMGLFANLGVQLGGQPLLSTPHVAIQANNPGANGGVWRTSVAFNGAQSFGNSGFAPILGWTYYQVTIETGITFATVTLIDLTRGITYTASVTIPSTAFLAATLGGNVAAAKWLAQIYGTATLNAIGTNTYLDVGSTYYEAD